MRKLKLTPRDRSCTMFDIELDGIKISKYVTSVTLMFNAGMPPYAVLYLVPLEIDIPDEINAVIEAEERVSAILEVHEE